MPIIHDDVFESLIRTSCNCQVCAVLFCWSGLLGMVGGVQALFAECFARQRSSAQAAANSLGLKASTLPHGYNVYSINNKLVVTTQVI